MACVALFAFAASATFAIICFGRQPHNADEVAQLFHAKILLSGRLALPPDPNPEFFGMDNMIDAGRWYSQFPVGGPAFLAIGLALRAAWLVNPVLLALTVLSVYGFARRAYGEAVARASALLFALCPFALFVGASFMNHVPVLWLTSVAMVQLAIWVDAEQRREANRAAAIIGLALGVAFAVRPLDALVAAGVIGVMQLTRVRHSAVRLRSIGAEIVGGLIPVAILFYVNWRTNGAPMRLGYEVLYGDAHSLGFPSRSVRHGAHAVARDHVRVEVSAAAQRAAVRVAAACGRHHRGGTARAAPADAMGFLPPRSSSSRRRSPTPCTGTTAAFAVRVFSSTRCRRS